MARRSRLERVGLEVGGSSKQASLLCAQVGVHRLVFDLRTLLALEGGGGKIDHEAIVGPVDLRTFLETESNNDDSPESLLVPGEDAVYRLRVCRVQGLVSSDLRQVHPVPAVLRPLADRLFLRGVVELEDGLAFLTDPKPLAAAAWRAQVDA